MSPIRTTCLCFFIACIVSKACAYSSGGPEGVCDSMRPSHGVAPQSTQSPYTVTASTATVNPGDTVQVTVTGSPNFKGFFVRAQQSGGYLNGQFQSQAGANLRCSSTGITHASSNTKSSVTLTWTAPNDLDSANGPIRFLATVVQARTTFWVQIPSADVAVSSGGNTGTGSTGSGNTGTGNTGSGNTGTGNTGTGNTGTGNTGTGSTGTGNTGAGGGGDDDDDDDNSAVGMEVGLGMFFSLLISVFFVHFH